jgi:mycofactocin precursor
MGQRAELSAREPAPIAAREPAPIEAREPAPIEAAATDRCVVPAPPGAREQRQARGEVLVIEDLLVEDISIDGMCGVY